MYITSIPSDEQISEYDYHYDIQSTIQLTVWLDHIKIAKQTTNDDI